MEMFDLKNWEFITSALLIKYLVNMVAVIILVRLIYFSYYKRSDLFLTFFGFNTIIFFVTYVLNKVEMSAGAAFGLFAVFSILRYRTEGISAKDMTYLFLSIALGLLSAVNKGNWVEQSVICFAILFLTYLLEGNILIKKVYTKSVQYDNIQLVHASKKTELLADLKQRTGLNVIRFEINEINYLRDTAAITVYYTENGIH